MSVTLSNETFQEHLEYVLSRLRKGEPRHPDRIETVLQTLSLVWHQNPDLRLGQLIANVSGHIPAAVIEDDQLLLKLKNTLTPCHPATYSQS